MKEPCRGFECKRFHHEEFGKGSSHSYCERWGQMQSQNMNEGSFEKCSACEHLNECTECIHSETCEYSTAK